MKQIYEKRLTKRGVRTFETTINGLPLLIVYSDIDKLRTVFRGVRSFEAEERLVARLVLEGITEFTEVIL